MKPKILTLILLFALFTACKRDNDHLCQDAECTNYFEIWKKHFLLKNQLSQGYFDSHITAENTSIRTHHGPYGIKGKEFAVYYTVKMDWAEVLGFDYYMTYLHPDDTMFTSPLLPHGIDFAEADLNLAAQLYPDHWFGSQEMYPIEKLAFNSRADAMNALRKVTEGTLRFEDIRLSRAGGSFPTGHPILTARIAKGNQELPIQFGSVDLLTKEVRIFRELGEG